jgi:predicted DNA-binding transcriptional regulator YafY
MVTAGTRTYRGDGVIAGEDALTMAATRRLAGFGGGVEVLSPAGVRDRLVAIARAVIERYFAT